MYSSSLDQDRTLTSELETVYLSNMQSTCTDLIENLRESALAVRYLDPLIQNCSLPNTIYNPERLIRLFNIFTTNPARQLNSLGVIRRMPNRTAAYGSQGKVSWQIAKYYLCSDLVYAFNDPQIYPQFWGYCVSADTASIIPELVYNGTDYGLKPLEELLLSGGNLAGSQAGRFFPHLSETNQLIFCLLNSLSRPF